ncbi:hypothetical protein [Corallococcus aberystwythensis]|uniref:hypothetical protein n=1 Tax=Corallococcus aberystwythensis TaxID=2316722 RepID=UPI0013158A74|nr:hypothetical protein [Corallococcus aberystwythensis]
MTVKVTLHELMDAGPKQKSIAQRACVSLEEALNHPEFSARVAKAKYKETRFRDADGRTLSVPADKVHSYVVSGAERATPSDSEIDLKIQLDRIKVGVLGATTPGKLPFRTAYWFINDCIKTDDVASLASHFIHEWLHVAGFYHHPNNKARGDVPYEVGRIVRELINERAMSGLLLREELQAAASGETLAPRVESLAGESRMARVLDDSDCGEDATAVVTSDDADDMRQ